MTILDALRDEHLFATPFAPPSWDVWKVALTALFALPLDDTALETYRRHTGRATAPRAAFREAFFVCGRRSGKSRIAALIAVFIAAFRDHSKHLAPGERGVVAVLAADRKQAGVVLAYVNGLVDSTPMLAAMVVGRTAESIGLANGITIDVHTSSFRSVRGYTFAAVIADELAFWRDDASVNPDAEVIAAVRPGLGSMPGSMLIGISSPYARKGVLWNAFKRYFAKDGAPVLVWQSDTRSMNPSVDESVIAKAYAEDEASASAEYGAEFRRDIESFVPPEAIAQCVVPDRRELPPSSFGYVAAVDPSGGSADSMTLCIAHGEVRGGSTISVIDCLRERRPPFSPEDVVEEFAELLRSYRISSVTGDRYAGDWPREQFRKRRINYRLADRAKSEIYSSFLPLLNSRRVDLLDHPRLIAQLGSLERRTTRGSGRDVIDHPGNPNAHDDVANAAAAAAVLVIAKPRAVAGFGWLTNEQREEIRWQREESEDPNGFRAALRAGRVHASPFRS